jgi:glycosyltransferase involved in cell wall biosynthesis
LIEVPPVPHEQLGEVLACADVMLLPFPLSGMNLGRFPARAGDYMAAGRPVVTNPTGDLGDFVRSERAGLVVGDDPRTMAQAVLRLLEDPALARELGDNGRRAAERELAWPSVAEKVLGFYGQLLAKN